MTVTLGDVVIEIDGRWVAYAIWGLGTVVIYGLSLRRGWRSWRVRRDTRSERELLERTARFLVALASVASLTLALFGEQGTAIRAIIVAIALGAFTAAGALELRGEPNDPVVDDVQGHWRG